MNNKKWLKRLLSLMMVCMLVCMLPMNVQAAEPITVDCGWLAEPPRYYDADGEKHDGTPGGLSEEELLELLELPVPALSFKMNETTFIGLAEGYSFELTNCSAISGRQILVYNCGTVISTDGVISVLINQDTVTGGTYYNLRNSGEMGELYVSNVTIAPNGELSFIYHDANSDENDWDDYTVLENVTLSEGSKIYKNGVLEENIVASTPGIYSTDENGNVIKVASLEQENNSQNGCNHSNVESKVITEASATTDGVIGWYCTNCGEKVGEEQTANSSFHFFLDGIKKDIESAETGSTVVIESKTWHTLTQETMLALAARRDINVEMTLRYNHEDYHYVIPAGTPIDTADKYYGPMYLGQLYGMTKVEK